MKRDQQTIDKRHKGIIELLKKEREMKVDELAAIFEVSIMTMRRDLQALEEKGELIRFHGGARYNARNVLTSEIEQEKRREAISAYAASLVQDGESLFINGSMTASAILETLKARNISVVTNNAFAAGYNKSDQIAISLTGGQLHHHIMVGDYCMRNLLMSYVDKAFLGCTGISPEGEILCDIPSELAINETMISHAREYYILADSHKLGRTKAMGSFTLVRPGTVITDNKAPEEIIKRLESQGMKVVLAG